MWALAPEVPAIRAIQIGTSSPSAAEAETYAWLFGTAEAVPLQFLLGSPEAVPFQFSLAPLLILFGSLRLALGSGSHLLLVTTVTLQS
jgi:hypothetical protein